MKRFCLALDLKDDPEVIAGYEKRHQQVPPEIRKSIADAGVIHMDIYLTGNRLFMIMDTEDDFSFEEKERMDLANPKVQQWEALMWQYQQALPTAAPGEKWVVMKEIFRL